MDQDLVRYESIAVRANVSVATVRRWVSAEGIAVVKSGDRRRRFIRSADAERLLAPRIVSPVAREDHTAERTA